MITRTTYWMTYGAAPRIFTFGIEVFDDTGIIADAAPVGRWMIGRRFDEIVEWIERRPEGRVVRLDGAEVP